MTGHELHTGDLKPQGAADHRPPTPQEELENLGLVTSREESHPTHHPEPGHDRDTKLTNAGSPQIDRPVA